LRRSLQCGAASEIAPIRCRFGSPTPLAVQSGTKAVQLQLTRDIHDWSRVRT